MNGKWRGTATVKNKAHRPGADFGPSLLEAAGIALQFCNGQQKNTYTG